MLIDDNAGLLESYVFLSVCVDCRSSSGDILLGFRNCSENLWARSEALWNAGRVCVGVSQLHVST